MILLSALEKTISSWVNNVKLEILRRVQLYFQTWKHSIAVAQNVV